MSFSHYNSGYIFTMQQSVFKSWKNTHIICIAHLSFSEIICVNLRAKEAWVDSRAFQRAIFWVRRWRRHKRSSGEATSKKSEPNNRGRNSVGGSSETRDCSRTQLAGKMASSVSSTCKWLIFHFETLLIRKSFKNSDIVNYFYKLLFLPRLSLSDNLLAWRSGQALNASIRGTVPAIWRINSIVRINLILRIDQKSISLSRWWWSIWNWRRWATMAVGWAVTVFFQILKNVVFFTDANWYRIYFKTGISFLNNNVWFPFEAFS
jgi:hypothetical protein